jgi:signal transduction histidine kinase
VKVPSRLPNRLRRAGRAWSLRARLILLVIVTMAPLLALGLGVQYFEYTHDKAVASERTLELARSIALQVGRELEADIRALQVLAKTGRLRRGDIEAFRQLAEAALTDRLEGANILVLEENGQQLLNTALPRGTQLPVRQHLDNIHEVFSSGEPRVSGVFFGTIVKRPGIAVEVPVKDEQDRVMFSLTLDPRPDTFVDILRRQAMRPGIVVALLDRDGTIIARLPDSNKYAGQKASPTLLANFKEAPNKTFESTTFDGVPVLTALSRVEPSGWTVAIGTPHSEYLKPLWSAVAVIVSATALVLAIGLVLARLVAGQITAAMDSLRAYADTARAGGQMPAPTGLRETDVLAGAIRRYVSAREKAESELVALNATLEQRIAAAVAERDAAQARLVEAQKMEAVGQLTGGIAHDFNNLLTAIIGSLDLMRKDSTGNPRLQTLLEISVQAAQRGALLVSQLLAFGRRQTLQPESVRLDLALHDIRLLIGPAAGGEVILETRLAPDLWPCHVDRSQLDSAVLNLVFNAHDAMPRGGRLTIAARNQPIDAAAAQQLDIAAGDYVRIDIADSGTGMTSDTLKRAFEPFFTTKGVGKGTGLGLSQVWGFAKQSGGTAMIDSRPGEGTTVSLLLPRAAGAAVPQAAATTVRTVPRKRILVVEDHKEVRALAQSLLEDLGHEAIVAANAEEALAILRSDTPIDLLFCDVVLGGPIDGVKLSQYAGELRPGLKVLLTSGYPDLVHGRTSEFDMIPKPYQQADLAAKIAALFPAV